MASDRESGHLIFRLWSSSLATCLLLAALQDHVSAFQISALHGLYICPEGQNVSLICKISGSLIDKHDLVGKVWFFSKHKEPNCVDKKHIRNVTEKELHFKNSSRYGVESTSDHHGTVRLTLTHLTMLDSGGYCCKVEEFKRDHGKTSVKQFSHGYMELQVKPAEKVLQNCTFHSFASEDNASITAAALATIACIVGILCLPIILLLVYKQRQAVSNRRAHELVRMDSNAQGIENPVFDEAPGGTAQPKPRLNFMASRQPSESGRHLLSEPNTPLSPPAIGDLFFPSLEPVPDSPPSTIVKI
ncbi:V-type immunoglobulin domain-containing suppressor of T-cell activation isoform X1 [Ambystoma mexicanum]|uniref:V-type immunoglobulin domain-containing suppressor of T-cell activation isoform X1 n=1 Tax=Ambystoma mexicanum TaxID=8296 RepID=UPI0037E7D269